jgi:hypothetical protein
MLKSVGVFLWQTPAFFAGGNFSPSFLEGRRGELQS